MVVDSYFLATSTTVSDFAAAFLLQSFVPVLVVEQSLIVRLVSSNTAILVSLNQELYYIFSSI